MDNKLVSKETWKKHRASEIFPYQTGGQNVYGQAPSTEHHLRHSLPWLYMMGMYQDEHVSSVSEKTLKTCKMKLRWDCIQVASESWHRTESSGWGWNARKAKLLTTMCEKIYLEQCVGRPCTFCSFHWGCILEYLASISFFCFEGKNFYARWLTDNRNVFLIYFQ